MRACLPRSGFGKACTVMTSSVARTASASLHLQCPPDTVDVRAARRHVDQFLRSRHVTDELVDRSLLVTSELLTNALEASPTTATIALAVSATDGLVTVAVENICPLGPEAIAAIASVSMPPAIADRGRGLPLVAASAARLSFTFEPGVVRVSADLLEQT